MNFDEEQVIALAPDPASVKAGKGLANPAKWLSRNKNEKALWGECKGSGKKPYYAQIDLQQVAFKCSCPSRKFPCKHALGLLFMYARDADSFSREELPPKVSEWLDQRNQRQEKQTKKAKTPSPEAQAKRLLARQKKVEEGIAELELWLKDILKNGLIQIPEKGDRIWKDMAKRMVDAQAPGIAARLREIAAINFFSDQWSGELMTHIAKLHTLIRAYKNHETLQEPLKSEIQSLVGFTVNQEELRAQKGIGDQWFVMGKKATLEDNLITEKIWLYGTQSRQYALFMQFYVHSQVPSISLVPGMTLEAELVFFPAAHPLRALIKEPFSLCPSSAFKVYPNLTHMAEAEKKSLQSSPFINQLPCIVDALVPAKAGQQWYLKDKEGKAIAIAPHFKEINKLLSISGGQPSCFSLIGKENCFEPLGIWQNNNYYIL